MNQEALRTKALNKVRPVLIRQSQLNELKKLAWRQGQQSGLGITPNVNAVARTLIDKALKSLESEQAAG